MGSKGERARSLVAWEINLKKAGWLYTPMSEADIAGLEERWCSQFAKKGKSDQFRLAMRKGYSNRAIDLLHRPTGLGLKTSLEEIATPALPTPVTLDISEVGHSLGWHLVGGGVSLGKLAPGEDATIAIVHGRRPLGIFWPHGEREEAIIVSGDP